jgi:hypothetical protein
MVSDEACLHLLKLDKSHSVHLAMPPHDQRRRGNEARRRSSQLVLATPGRHHHSEQGQPSERLRRLAMLELARFHLPPPAAVMRGPVCHGIGRGVI